LTPSAARAAPGEPLAFKLDAGGTPLAATLVLRVSDAAESGGASFDDAPPLLASGATTLQAPASSDPSWHTYAEPAGSHAADIFALEPPQTFGAPSATLGAASPRIADWEVRPLSGASFTLNAPNEPGRYVLSVLAIARDGDVGAASTTFEVP
ncbi:MAG: hypothetical protein ACREM2_02245, partial [Vulcanimicrobiaceae bacterium]